MSAVGTLAQAKMADDGVQGSARAARTHVDNSAPYRAMVPNVPMASLSSIRLHKIAERCFVARHPKVRNWGGSFVSRPQCLFAPSDVEQCCALIELARRMGNVECRALGQSHSPSDIVFTQGWLLRMNRLSGLLSIDTDKPSITVLAGTFVSDIHVMLEKATVPLAMPNLGSISEQTIGGLISTATHGTGINSPVLSASVLSMRIVCALDVDQGGTQVITCSRSQNAELFNATLCGLGATGLIVEVTIEVDHWFKLKQISEECSFGSIFGASNGWPAVHTWVEGEHDLSFNGRSAIDTTVRRAAHSLTSGSEVTSEEPAKGMPNKQQRSLGALLAHRPQLVPACPDDRLPTYRSADARMIYPIADSHNSTHKFPSANADADLPDHETRQAQLCIETLASSAQHVRLAWFPHADRVTVMRVNRTLEPVQSPGLASRLYGRLIGFHLLQIMLYFARFSPASLAGVNRFSYWLTHPAAPSPPVTARQDKTRSNIEIKGGSSEQSTASSLSHSQPDDRHVNSAAGDLARFKTGTFDPSQLAQHPDAFTDPAPLDTRNPRSVLVDAAPRIFNVDCLFQQYTNEWAIPLSHAASALRAMRDWLAEEEQKADGDVIHFPVEIRFADADGIWLSPCHGRKTCYIGIVQYRYVRR